MTTIDISLSADLVRSTERARRRSKNQVTRYVAHTWQLKLIAYSILDIPW